MVHGHRDFLGINDFAFKSGIISGILGAAVSNSLGNSLDTKRDQPSIFSE